MAPDASTGRVVVAVDLGTTFSGWPGGSNLTTEKAPTEIAYTDQSSRPRWGFQLRPGDKRLRCIKLQLDPGQQLPSYVSQSELSHLMMLQGKSAQTAVADYLRELWGHAKEALTRRWPFLSRTATDIILTVPAVWSDAAKDATLKAAKQAGMGDNITLISEPEAAAVYTLKSMQLSHLRQGNVYIVCDAGGGTVDLISFEVTQLLPLRLIESAAGDGDCCGATMLNMRFEELVRTIVGPDVFAAICRDRSRAWEMALRYFEEYVKRNFDPDDMSADFFVPFNINDGEARGVEEGFMLLTATQIWSIFEPVVNSVIRLIESQIHRVEARGKSVNGILLVGGFGQSNCLFKKLQAKFRYLVLPPPYPGSQNAAQQSFEVMQPNNAWTAVVRGGVLRGLEGTELVLSRVSRRHYGVMCNKPFDPAKHPRSCRYWSRYEESFRARNRMTWYITKGQTCNSEQPILFDFFRTFPYKKGSKVVNDELMVCDLDEAPDGDDNGAGARMRVLCTLTVDLNAIPQRYWENRTNSKREKYQRLDYQLGMQIKSGGIHFDLRVDDVVYGNVTAKFE